MVRFLRRDDDSLGIRRELGQMKLVQTNLIPIICEYHSEETLFDVTLRLLVNLTNPTLLLFNEELPTEKTARHYYLQHISHLQSYKPCLALDKFWMVLTDKLKLLLVKVSILQSPYDTGNLDISWNYTLTRSPKTEWKMISCSLKGFLF